MFHTPVPNDFDVMDYVIREIASLERDSFLRTYARYWHNLNRIYVPSGNKVADDDFVISSRNSGRLLVRYLFKSHPIGDAHVHVITNIQRNKLNASINNMARCSNQQLNDSFPNSVPMSAKAQHLMHLMSLTIREIPHRSNSSPYLKGIAADWMAKFSDWKSMTGPKLESLRAAASTIFWCSAKTGGYPNSNYIGVTEKQCNKIATSMSVVMSHDRQQEQKVKVPVSVLPANTTSANPYREKVSIDTESAYAGGYQPNSLGQQDQEQKAPDNCHNNPMWLYGSIILIALVVMACAIMLWFNRECKPEISNSQTLDPTEKNHSGRG